MRGSSRRRRLVLVLGAALAVTWTFAFLAFGGVHAGSRAVLHGLLALCLALALALPNHTLERAGRAWPVLGAGALLIGAALAGLLPVPWLLAGLVAPGLRDRLVSFGVTTATLDPEATVGAVTHLVLVLSAATALALWSIASWRRRPIELALLVGALALPVLALAHAWTDTTALFGVFPTWIKPPFRFFAPFISHNHAGSALLLPFPLLLWGASDPEAARSSRVGHAALAVLTVVALLDYSSTGPLAVAGVQALLVLTRRRWLPPFALLALGVVGLVLAVAWDNWSGSGDTLGLHGRGAIWAASLRLLANHWLLGSGAGTYVSAIAPYRRDTDWVVWDHAHQDYLEWLATTGAVGLVAAVAAVVLLRPRPSREVDRAFVLVAGAAGVLLHALVDFPLQVPALAMSAAGLVAVRVAAHGERTETRPALLRAALAALLAANVLSGLWQLREREVGPAAEALRDAEGDQVRAAATLARWAPWRSELAVHEAREALAAGREDEARRLAVELTQRFPDDPTALRSAGLILVRLGAADEARAAVERAVSEGPWDWANHLARARVLTRVAPDEAPAAWKAAVGAGAPPSTFPEAWAVVPVGLYWVDAVDGRSTIQDAALATFLQRMGDAEAAALAWERAALSEPDQLHPGYVDALLALERPDQAEAYVTRALADHPDDPSWLRRLALLREEQERWREASDAWLRASTPRKPEELRAVRAMARAAGDEAALALVKRLDLEGATLDDKVILERARLQAALGLGTECVTDLQGSGLLDGRRSGPARKALEACLQAAREKKEP